MTVNTCNTTEPLQVQVAKISTKPLEDQILGQGGPAHEPVAIIVGEVRAAECRDLLVRKPGLPSFRLEG